jgi:hypothetical protein
VVSGRGVWRFHNGYRIIFKQKWQAVILNGLGVVVSRVCSLIESRVSLPVFYLASSGVNFPRQGWRGATMNIGQKILFHKGLYAIFYTYNFAIYVLSYYFIPFIILFFTP